MALVFAVIGLLLFVFMYVRYIEGRFYDAMQEPSTILFLVVPFMPAAVLSFLASRLEKKLASYKAEDSENSTQ
jgi:hypothetical protein